MPFNTLETAEFCCTVRLTNISRSHKEKTLFFDLYCLLLLSKIRLSSESCGTRKTVPGKLLPENYPSPPPTLTLMQILTLTLIQGEDLFFFLGGGRGRRGRWRQSSKKQFYRGEFSGHHNVFKPN